MKTNVFIVGACYPAEIGGPSNTIFNLAKALNLSGKPTLILSTLKGITPHHIKKYSIQENKITMIEGIPVIFYSYRISYIFSLKMLGFCRSLEKNKYTIHLNSVFYLQTLLVSILALIKGINFSIAPRGELLKPALGSKQLKKRVYGKLVNFLLKKSSRIIVTSEAEKESVTERIGESYDKKINILPNYLEMPEYNMSEISIERKTILYLGRLNPHKCIDSLIYAYNQLDASLKKEHPLIIAGKGNPHHLKALQKLVASLSLEDNVTFIGHVAGEKKLSLLKKCELFVLPSKSENFGNVIVEAISQGAPALASLGAPWEILEATKSGFHVENSIKSLKSHIEKYLNFDAFQKENYRKNAVNLFSEKFSLKNNINKIIETLNI